jgi:excisionase family DNA binding protein
MNPNLCTPQQAARYLGRTEGTLQTWRCTGKHALPFVKSGGRVLYRLKDLDTWLENRTFTNTGQFTSSNHLWK